MQKGTQGGSYSLPVFLGCAAVPPVIPVTSPPGCGLGRRQERQPQDLREHWCAQQTAQAKELSPGAGLEHRKSALGLGPKT